MNVKRHGFTDVILEILEDDFRDKGDRLLAESPLLQYLNTKTVSADRGSKSRGSFGNIYAIYVLVEDYLQKGFAEAGEYEDYEGARFSDLFQRQRELPFGSRLQNHALNHRLNQEFVKYFPLVEQVPIVRDPETSRYWINERLLVIEIDGESVNLAEAVVRIIDAYVDAKTGAFTEFIDQCKRMRNLAGEDVDEVSAFLSALLAPNIDARIFEIVSYSILRKFYGDETVFIGPVPDQLEEESLVLYKTGRTNANDGGIDFVMRPLGRFFQVTEAIDVRKFFLDIDKLHHYPVTFVVKSESTDEKIRDAIRQQARDVFAVSAVVEKCMNSIEEIINVPDLVNRLETVRQRSGINDVIDEVVRQAQFEFHLPEE